MSSNRENKLWRGNTDFSGYVVDFAVLDSVTMTSPKPLDAHVISLDSINLSLIEFKTLFYPDNESFQLNIAKTDDPKVQIRGQTVKSIPFKLIKAVIRFYADDLGVELNCMDPCTTTEITSQITQYKSLMDFCEVNCHLSYSQLIEVLYNKAGNLDNLFKKHNFRLYIRFHNSNKDIKDVVVVFNYTVDFRVFIGSEPEFTEILNIINESYSTPETHELNMEYIWTQIGNEITGDTTDQLGISVAMSKDGQRFAISSNSSGANSMTEDKTYVDCYKLVENDNNNFTFEQLGQRIENQGHDILMNDDGNRIGIFKRHPQSQYSTLNIFDYIEQTAEWTQVGQTINNIYGKFDIDMNNDGNRIVIKDGDNVIKLYNYDNTNTWTIITTLKSVAKTRITMNDTGGRTRIIISDETKINPNVKVYDYDHNSQSWTQVGETIEPEGSQEAEETNIFTATSLDGNRIAIGVLLYISDSSSYKKYVQIFDYTEQTAEWTQAGQTIESQSAKNTVIKLRMSDDGKRILISNFDEKLVDGTYKPYSIMYEINDELEWKQLGQNVTYFISEDNLGYAYIYDSDINNNGNLFINGYRKRTKSSLPGLVKIYKLL